MVLVKTNKGIGYFNTYILQRIRNNKNFICCVTGPTGSGKSWSALRECEVLDKNFDINNVCFTARNFMDLINGKIKDLKKGSCILFDEIQVTLGHLDYQTLQAKLLNYVLSTFRHKNFILFVTSPHFNFINASARKLFHSRMETISIDKNNKQVKMKPLLLQINQDSGDVYRKYLRVYTKEFGVVPLKTMNVSMPTKELIKDYEQKKTDFTAELNENIAKDLQKLEGVKEHKPLTALQKEVVEHLDSGKSVKEIAELMNRPFQTIYTMMEWIRKKGIEFEPIKRGKVVLRYNVKGYIPK